MTKGQVVCKTNTLSQNGISLVGPRLSDLDTPHLINRECNALPPEARLSHPSRWDAGWTGD